MAGPVEGARIWIGNRSAVTGADGCGEVGSDDLGVVWVWVSKEGYREVEVLFPGGVDAAEAFLVPGVPLRGRVVRAVDGAPVPSAEVHAADCASTEELCHALVTDAEGRFTVPGVASGTRFVVAAVSTGFAPASTTGVAASDEADLRVVLGVGATVKGTVRDGDGKGAADVAIRVFPSGDDFLTRSFDSSVMEQTRLRAAARAVTDLQGGYTVAGLPAGEYTLLALSASGASAKVTFTVTTPEDDVVVDLALVATGSIRVRVLDPDGRPVAGARLSINDAKAKWIYGPRVASETNANGEALATGLEPGAYEILTQPARWTAARAQVVVENGPPVDVAIRVERGVSLEGVVHDSAGRPVAGLDVYFDADDQGRSLEYKRTVTDRQGHFVLDGLLPAPGNLQVSDWADRWSSFAADAALPGGPPLDVVVRPLAAVTGRFEPLPASRQVTYTIEVGNSRQTSGLDLDRDGRFVIFGVDEGVAATLYFDVPGACLVSCPIVPLEPGERRDLGTLVTTPGRTLSGRATDQDGRPWALTRLWLGYDDCDFEKYALTDENGRFSFENVDPARPVSITVWSKEQNGRVFELEDWSAKPMHELLVNR